jgi:DNA-damage-inducible protein J
MLDVEGGDDLAQAMVNFRMDEGLKASMEQVCKEMGMSMTTAFTIFASKVSKDRRIPFDISADPDPFYSEANMNRLRKAISDVESGKATLTEHELIEVDDE